MIVPIDLRMRRLLRPAIAVCVLMIFGALMQAGCGSGKVATTIAPGADSASIPPAETTSTTRLTGQDAATATTGDEAMTAGNTTVIIKTSMGDITAELYGDSAPISVQNFLSYVNDKFYDGTIFHRVILGFMIQGGGFTSDMQQKPTSAPIKNEADNGLKNLRGTLAMARTGVVDSATSQFFINVADNAFLNFKAPNPQGYGYAVFGAVTSGMDVVDAIVAVPTGSVRGMSDVPTTAVVIESITVKE